MKYTMSDKKNGKYEVQYSTVNVPEGEHFTLGITLCGHHIRGSPFSVRQPSLLLEFSSAVNHPENWLNAAVKKLSDIPSARLWVQLSDVNGAVVYKATGVTSCEWTKNAITAPKEQYPDNMHTNAIHFDNGDTMMIMSIISA